MPRDLIEFPEVVAPKLSPQELMATPEPMLAWLRSKHPEDVVAGWIGDGSNCLGATFLRESGHPGAQFGWFDIHRLGPYPVAIPSWFSAVPTGAVYRLGLMGHAHGATAAQAIAAIEAAQ